MLYTTKESQGPIKEHRMVSQFQLVKLILETQYLESFPYLRKFFRKRTHSFPPSFFHPFFHLTNTLKMFHVSETMIVTEHRMMKIGKLLSIWCLESDEKYGHKQQSHKLVDRIKS